MFPMAFGWLGRTRWGLPGVHGFYAGNDWELFRHVRPGDRMTAIERVVGVEVKESKFSGRWCCSTSRPATPTSAANLSPARLGTCTRHERKAARDAGKYNDIKTHEYTTEEFDRIDQMRPRRAEEHARRQRALLGRSAGRRRTARRSCAVRCR